MRFLLYGLVLLATRLHAADASVTKQIEPDSPAIVFTRASGSVVLVKAEIGNIGNQAKNSALGGVSQGSGVIVAKDQIVTNLHVVAGATKIVVAIRGRELEAKVIAVTKKDRDLALLAVETKDGSRAILRKSTDLAVGERVFAIGNPRGYEQTLTDGLVSALRKEGTAFVIQTSAAISPGSSGGGLFDSKGKLVGITTKQRVDGQNLNFAHPAEWIEELLQGKRETSNEPEALPLYSVSNRPAALVCQLHESAKWGLFSEGTELLESTPHKSEVVLSALDSTQPELNGDTGLVLLDLSRKSQVAVFGTKDPSDEIVFVTFEETGDIRTTLARVEREAGVPRLLTRSGICSVTSTIELATRRSRKPSVTELCEADADQCYTAAGEVAGGERFLLLKKACKLGHAAACDEAASLAQTVGDVANVALLKQLRSSATIGLRVQPPKDSAPNQVDPSVRVRKPLQKVH